jgi:oligosaccharide repeat unit polymerase
MNYTIPIRKFTYWVIWSILTLYCVLVLNSLIPMPSDYVVTLITLFVFALINIYPKSIEQDNVALFGLTHVHIIYASLGAFGLAWVYYFFGRDEALKYNSIGVINAIFGSSNYGKALILSSLSFLCYELAVEIGRKNFRIKRNRVTILSKKVDNYQENSMERTLSILGLVFLSAFLIFILFMMVTGRLSLRMSYQAFMERVSSNDIYTTLIMLYSVGICYIIACGKGAIRTVGLVIYGLIAVVLLLTGNKGEVLYAVLACVGVVRRQGKKINARMVIGAVVLVFIIIPFITTTRSSGVMNSISGITANFTGFFNEVGGQLRCTTRVLDQFDSGSRQYIWGFSYYNPIINIIDRLVPFMNLRISAPDSFDFKQAFASWGFNQVAEGYANFGTVGSCAYFFITGLFLSSREHRSDLTNAEIAYYGSLCSVLINVSRNKFAFFWGQAVILTLIFVLVKWVCTRNSSKE